MTATQFPNRAMILAAGHGRRLAGLTTTTPKPLLRVGGRALIDLARDQLLAAGVYEIVVNTHHLADQIERHVSAWSTPHVRLSREEELLDTGGGVAQARRWLGINPFYVLNSDLVWLSKPGRALLNLARAWKTGQMDVLLLAVATVDVKGYIGQGDFAMAADGRLTRRTEGTMAPFLFTGAQIIHPRVLAKAPAGKFSLNLIYDQAAAAGRLYGLRHDSPWIDAGTPERLNLAGEALADARQGELW
jgi:MurNAc alpha-1-phosphate uridylyltransferase